MKKQCKCGVHKSDRQKEANVFEEPPTATCCHNGPPRGHATRRREGVKHAKREGAKREGGKARSAKGAKTRSAKARRREARRPKQFKARQVAA